MSSKNYDPAYTETFKRGFIAHLNNTRFAVETENQPRQLISQAKNNTAKLSRIFDQFEVPILNKITFEEAIRNAGSVEEFMRPALKDITQVLLNSDKTRLHDDVIAAIGTQDYADIVGGIVNAEGKVVPKSGDEASFIQKEAEVARLMTSAIIVNYSLRVADYALTPDEQSVNEQCNALLEAGNKLKQNVPLEQRRNLTVKSVQFNSDAATALINKINSPEIENQKPSDLIELYRQCLELNDAGRKHVDEKAQHFSTQFMIPMNTLAADFTLNTLEKQAPKLSLEQIKQKAATLLQLVNTTNEEIRESVVHYRTARHIPLNQPVPELDNLTNSVRTLKQNLEELFEVEEAYPDANDDTIRDLIEKKYNNAVNLFASKLQQDVLKAKPPAPLMNAVLRLLRAIFTLSFSMTTASEKADLQRFKDETKIIEDIAALKKNHTPNTALDNQSTKTPDLVEENKTDSDSRPSLTL
ncbi:hypothetical protein [Legionella worsleiensis]|uniref:Uncharacterized protein n=1 Tax=Legionella worsleiensis TaxID=45076 RepID=A0A0W1AH47_9GAMM|nr:hypothetical protein [Legionella worsleiensis]KTD80685.1 hypothetical protein Lwor_0928 [Legionella worsleiensis]STY32737.1 Uncharacterised protein [Legionella worsleiensis]